VYVYICVLCVYRNVYTRHTTAYTVIKCVCVCVCVLRGLIEPVNLR